MDLLAFELYTLKGFYSLNSKFWQIKAFSSLFLFFSLCSFSHFFFPRIRWKFGYARKKKPMSGRKVSCYWLLLPTSYLWQNVKSVCGTCLTKTLVTLYNTSGTNGKSPIIKTAGSKTKHQSPMDDYVGKDTGGKPKKISCQCHRPVSFIFRCETQIWAWKHVSNCIPIFHL